MAVLVVLPACSRSERSAPPGPDVSSTTTPGVAASPSATSAGGEVLDPGTAPSSTGPAVTSPPTLPPTLPPISVAELDEVGTPGLDSDDRFCAAWSRFAGSFQVVAVTAAFGSGPPDELAALEVAAAPTVVRSFAELFEHWPDQLADERDLVAERFLGPFARRLADADAALESVGADGATIDRISDAWLAGLARRDPSTPEFTVDLSDADWAVIDAAADVFAAQRVGFGQDPSLVTDVATPLTDAYLQVSCPDQGTLSGQEIDSP